MRLLQALAASFALVLFVFLVLTAVAGAWPAALTSAFAISATMVVLARASRSPKSVGWILLCACWVVTTIAAATTGGLGTASFAWLLLCPLLGGLTSGRAGSVVGSILASVTLLGLVWAHHRGLSLPIVFDESDRLVQDVVDSVAVSACVGLSAWLFLREQRWAEEKLLESIDDLAAEVVERTEAERRAVRAKEAEERFLAVASHELRTPLNGVLGITQILAQRNLGDEANRWVRDLERASMHLQALVDQILDFSARVAPDRDAATAPFDLAEVVHDARATLAGQVGDEVTVRVEIEPGLPTRRSGPRDQVAQILSNLGGNALKFTRQGEIVLGLAAIAGTADAVRCTVRDTGVGIAADDLEQIFEPFIRDDLAAPDRRGLGLGLAIVKELVSAMGGTIQVESGPGQGTHFDLELPLPVAPPEDAPSTPLATSAPAVGRALVAEDDPISQTVTTAFLESMGWTVVTAGDGLEALEELTSGRYDLGVLDGALPSMEGTEIARSLRRRGLDTPLVAITAFAMPGDRERFLDAGVDAYLAKPVRFEQLREVVASLEISPAADSTDPRSIDSPASGPPHWRSLTD